MSKPRITTYYRKHSPLAPKSMNSLQSNSPKGKAQIVEMRLADGSITWVPYLTLFPEMEYTIRRCMASFIEPENKE